MWVLELFFADTSCDWLFAPLQGVHLNRISHAAPRPVFSQSTHSP